MSEVLGDLQRRLANIVRRGVIHSVRLEGGFAECRVDLGDIVTTWLPLCQGFAGKNRADFEPFAVGDAVTVLSEAGELNNGRVFPGWNTGVAPAPQGSDSEHITRYGDGTEICYNRDTHSLTIILAEGGTYAITGNGVLDGNVMISENLIVNGRTMVESEMVVKSDFYAEGDVTDKGGSMNRIRETFNEHDHPGDSGGTTKVPNKKM